MSKYSAEEVRERFEVWYNHLTQHPYAMAYNNPLGLPVEGDMKGGMWLGYKAAYAERIKAGEGAVPFGYVSRNMAPVYSNTPAWKFTRTEVKSHGCIEAMPLFTHPPAQAAQVDQVGELLAIIHGDGGHYQAEHGLQKAAKDAQEKVIQMMTRIATAEPVAQVDDDIAISNGSSENDDIQPAAQPSARTQC